MPCEASPGVLVKANLDGVPLVDVCLPSSELARRVLKVASKELRAALLEAWRSRHKMIKHDSLPVSSLAGFRGKLKKCAIACRCLCAGGAGQDLGNFEKSLVDTF